MAKHLRRPSRRQRVSRALVVPVGILAAVAATSPAYAGKPSGGTSGNSLSVKVLSGPDQTPNYGEMITFNVTSSTYYKWVDLKCYQGSTFVYEDTKGFYPDYPWAPDYTLSSSYWTGGGASCTARLYTQSNSGKQSTLATLSFTVFA